MSVLHHLAPLATLLLQLTALQTATAGPTNPSCYEVEEKVAEADRNTVILSPPPIAGLWVSEKCETRTGPEYLLRRHSYTDNDTFAALLHTYKDLSCSRPWYSALSRGRVALKGSSWMAQDASQADFSLESVALVAHSQKAADELSRQLNQSCPGVVRQRWRPSSLFTIYTSDEAAELVDKRDTEWSVAERSCLKALRLAPDPAVLLRLQERPPGPLDPDASRTELLLGEVKAKGTSFHLPLLLANKVVSCEVCTSVERSSVLNPPRLSQPAASPLLMTGEWVSTRCEVRPMGLYLRRRLRVSGRQWQADYNFFSESSCSTPTLTASAEGTLSEVSTRRIPGATDYDFRVLRAFLTLHDEGVQASLNADGTCGPPGLWQLGVRRDVTPSSGCPALGITVPTTEYELVRLELDGSGQALLYLGQAEQRKAEKKQRPTSFQPPLLQCNAPELPPLTHFLNSINGADRARIAIPLALLVLWLF